MNTTSGRTRFASSTFLAPALAVLIGLSAYPAQEARAFAADACGFVRGATGCTANDTGIVTVTLDPNYANPTSCTAGSTITVQLNVEVDEYSEGGQNGFVHKLPGRMTWPNLVFRRGITDSDALFAWVQKSSGEGFAANGNKLTRSTGAVTIVDAESTRLRAWDLEGVFPIRWTGPKLSVNESAALEEELEVAHAGFRAKTS